MTIKKRQKNNGFDLEEYVRRKENKIKSKTTKISIKEAEQIIETANVVTDFGSLYNVGIYRYKDY